MARLLKICKECNKPFSINDKQQEWLKSRELQMFERCKECREKRRAAEKARPIQMLPKAQMKKAA